MEEEKKINKKSRMTRKKSEAKKDRRSDKRILTNVKIVSKHSVYILTKLIQKEIECCLSESKNSIPSKMNEKIRSILLLMLLLSKKLSLC